MRIRQHVVPAKAGTHTPQQYRETAEYGSRASLSLARDDSTSTRRPREGGDPYAAAISRNCGIWIPGLAHARPGRQHINTSSPSPPARGQAPAGTHRPQQYRETAEYGSRASLTLARDDSTSTRRPRPRLREDRLQRGPIRRSNIEKLRSMDPGASLALARDDRGTMAPG